MEPNEEGFFVGKKLLTKLSAHKSVNVQNILLLK